MPPLEFVDIEAHGFHRVAQQIAVPTLKGGAARVKGIGALRHFVVDAAWQYSGGLFLFAATFFGAALLLLQLGTKWRTSWQEDSAERAGIFSYRSFAGDPMGFKSTDVLETKEFCGAARPSK